MDDLSGKAALVTGAARRIGRAAALALANAGADVVLHYRSSSAEAEEVVEQIEKLGSRAWRVPADLASQGDLDSLIDRAWDAAGRLDILVNNASVFPASDFATLSLEQLIESVSIDAWAPFALGRRFSERAESGHIVNVLDTRIAGSYDWNHVGYTAAKYLLALFTRMMAIRFAPRIAVNAVAPGLILPPVGKDQAYMETLSEQLPLKRVGSPADVTDAILYLVTSRFITGQVIFVDGGRHLKEASIG